MTRPSLAVLALSAALGLGAWPASAQPVTAEDPVTVTVVPFSSADVGQHAWLGKAIADILNRQLAQVPGVTVLERARVQAFLAEMELQDSGFFTQEDAGRMGRVARVDQVIYGNFSLARNRLEINLILVDLATQDALQRGRASGPLERLHELVAQLSLDLLAGRGVVLSAEDSAAVRFAPTDSLPATQHFYQALDHLDHGRNEDAFGAFYKATKQDPDYREAQLWKGRVLEFLGFDELAVIALDELARQPGRRVETYDALMFMAGLLEDSDVDRAIATYRALVETRPLVPHSLEAAYRLAGLLEREEDYAGAYRALAFIDGFRDLVAQNQNAFAGEQHRQAEPSLTGMAEIANYLKALFNDRPAQQAGAVLQPLYVSQSGIRQSRFFDWSHALDLYREAIVRMAMLYLKLPPNRETGERPDAPRGVFLVDPANPVIAERRFRQAPSLFHEERYTENWLEAFYAVVIPEGYVATGAELKVTGRTLAASMAHSFAMRLMPFPLPRNYQNAWLGAVYGQTKSAATLHKPIYFHGRNRRFLALQLIENYSEISGWELTLHLRRTDGTDQTAAPAPTPAADFWEGQAIAHIAAAENAAAGATLPSFRKMTQARRGLALADNGRDGLYLVAVRGELGGRPTDLWLSHRDPGGSWSAPRAMAVNAASEDYAPRLVRAEHGGLRLFWLSNRRGRGWDLWSSELRPGNDRRWTAPMRVPLEDFVATGPQRRSGEPDQQSAGPDQLLLFAATQDRRGRWLLAYYAPEQSRLIVLVSADGADWRMAASHELVQAPANLMLVEDAKGVTRLGALTQQGSLRLWRSNDLERWTMRQLSAQVLGAGWGSGNYASYLLAEPDGRLLLLLSDRTYGLQFARFDPDTSEPAADLVKQAGMEDFAATATDQGSYLVALRESDGITLRRYRKFQSPAVPQNPRWSRLYTEVEADGRGNSWRRTIARGRFILPDVTAVGVQPDGRVWWAVESGVFSMDGQDSFFQDVSQGFFHHYVSDILPCGKAVYFASRFLPEPKVGSALPRRGAGRTTYTVEATRLEGAAGRITALACDRDKRLIVGTSEGDVVVLQDTEIVRRLSLARGQSVAAIAADPGQPGSYLGTDQGRLYRLAEDLQEVDVGPARGHAIQAMAIDRDQRLWLAIEGRGLYRRHDGRWQDRSALVADLPYFSVAALRADPVAGIWLLPHPEVAPLGLGYSDGETLSFFNPPHRRLSAPVDFDVAADGSVWIGTGFHGLYKLERPAP